VDLQHDGNGVADRSLLAASMACTVLPLLFNMPIYYIQHAHSRWFLPSLQFCGRARFAALRAHVDALDLDV